MALTRLQQQDLDRWIQNGRSWQDPDDNYDCEDDDYAFLDEDSEEDYNAARYADLHDD